MFLKRGRILIKPMVSPRRPTKKDRPGRAALALALMALVGSLAFYAGFRHATSRGVSVETFVRSVRGEARAPGASRASEPRGEADPEATVQPEVVVAPEPEVAQEREAAPPTPVAMAPVRAPESRAPKGRTRQRARVAIVIDDFGHRYDRERPFIEASRPYTLAVLPHLRDSRRVAEEGARAGKCVLLHLPMETSSGVDPGPGTLRTDMGDEELARAAREAFEAVPGIVGFNNHEGSKGSGDARVVEAALLEARERGLFVLDSRTTASTVLGPSAARMGLPTLSRHVFLDNDDDVARIAAQVEELGRRALASGFAVAIGHPRPRTFEALEAALPGLEAQGVEVVSLADLIAGEGSPAVGANIR